MPKKPTNKRLDKLFDGIQDEQAKPQDKPKQKAAPRPAEKKPAVSAAHPVATRPAPHASLPQTRGLPPLENTAVTQRGGTGTPSSLSLAFQIDNRNWATLQVVDEATARDWDSDEQLLVKQVVDQLSQALESARLFQETRSRAEELSVLNEMGRELTSLFSVEAIAKTVHKYASRLMDTTNFFVALYDEARQEITPFYVVSNRERIDVPARKLGNSLTDFVLRTCKPLFIPEDLPARVKELGIEIVTFGNNRLAQCWMGAPLLVGDTVLGAVGVQNLDSPNIFTERHRDLLIAISSQAAIAIQNARLFEETRESREALARSEGELRALFSAMNDVIIVYDKDGRYIRIAPTNPSRLFLPPQEMIGKLVSEVLPASIAEILMSAIRRALETGETISVEYPLTINQVEYWFEGAVSKLTEEQVFLVARDITERRRVSEVLRASEERFRTILDNIEDGFYEIDLAGNLTFLNPALARILGRPLNELIGVNNRAFMPPAELKNVFQTYNRVFKTKIPEQAFNWDLMRSDGTFRSVETSVSPIQAKDGSITGFRGTVRDITERKRQEQALVRRNEYLSATAEIGQIVTSTLDMPTLLSRTVNLVRDRFGFYHAGIFVTEETGFRAVLQAATGEAGAEMLRQKHGLQVGSKSIVGEVTESGRAVVVNDTVESQKHKFNPLLPETRAEAAIPLRVGVRIIGALDIQSTAPNAFSEDDIAVLQTLADQVAIAIDNARSYELSMQAVKEMREADKLKSQFLANMSHELRTPLNSIIGFSRVILKGIDGPVTDLQQQDLLAIHNSGQHLLGLINDILDLSRIEAGKMELTFDEVNLSELITSVMSTAAGLVKEKPITLHRDLPADLPTVRADAMRIRQVLINLFSNAAKFTDEGTITVHASVADNAKGHPEITVSVTDTGLGISQEDQKKLFQPFSQVDASPTRKSGGSGLGLSISNHLIQMHGGHIGVDSEPGKGSTFYFTLPAFRGKPETASPQNARVILAIDDDPQVISLYERYLQPQGYQVVALSDPSRAVDRVRQLKPFAVTLDIMMPGYDGWHVLNDLKSNAETRNVPVIVCSIVEEQEKGFNLGAADYLVKPILEDDLLNALDRLNNDGNLREILIVDDNPNDLRLISQMISGHGNYQPILAEGGHRGWESIQMRAPDAVILDLFMPDMDGFSLLEKMRSDDKLRDIPVIIVSGGDLTPDQQKQMQEFGKRMILKHALTKTELVAALERTLERTKK